MKKLRKKVVLEKRHLEIKKVKERKEFKKGRNKINPQLLVLNKREKKFIHEKT